MHLSQIHTEDLLGPSLKRVWMSRSKVKVTRDKNVIFWPFRGLRAVYVWENLFSLLSLLGPKADAQFTI